MRCSRMLSMVAVSGMAARSAAAGTRKNAPSRMSTTPSASSMAASSCANSGLPRARSVSHCATAGGRLCEARRRAASAVISAAFRVCSFSTSACWAWMACSARGSWPGMGRATMTTRKAATSTTRRCSSAQLDGSSQWASSTSSALAPSAARALNKAHKAWRMLSARTAPAIAAVRAVSGMDRRSASPSSGARPASPSRLCASCASCAWCDAAGAPGRKPHKSASTGASAA